MTVAVADNDQSAKAETASAFDNFGDPVDMDHFLSQFTQFTRVYAFQDTSPFA
jgi:hypothetical protein